MPTPDCVLRNRWCWPETITLSRRRRMYTTRPLGQATHYSCRRPGRNSAPFCTSASPKPCGRPPMPRGSIRFGTTKPALGRRTRASGSTICCCRPRPPTAWRRSASTSTSAAGKSRPTMCPPGSNLICEDQDYSRRPLSAAGLLDPLLHMDQRHRTLGLARLLQSGGVKVRNPGLLRSSCVPCENQPHQASRSVARHGLAPEQHGAEHRLSLVLALGGGGE